MPDNITLVPNATVDVTSNSGSAPTARAPQPKVVVHPATVFSSSQSASSPEPPVAQPPETDVTFRRDPSGRIFYVLTDVRSGKELEELPPAAVRKVGQGIEDYLKQRESKATPHLEEKA